MTVGSESDRDAVVLHDGSIHPGGAVDVVLAAAEALDADLVVGFSGPDPEWWEERAPNDVEVLTRRTRTWFLKDLQVAWKLLGLDLSAYDLVVSSGAAAKFYQPRDAQRVVHYMHHPPLSVLWYDGGLFDYVTKTVDRIETWSIPTIVTNSELTADRLAALYDREAAAVVNPPVDVDRFGTGRERQPNEVVMVGRVEGRKRTDVAVEAFAGFDGPPDERPQLHVLGEGPQRSALEGSAPENVHFHGYVDDEALVERVERAGAGLFLARREDFGITPVEYMAAGTPVVGVDEPNTNNQVVDGENGVLVDPGPAAVREGVRRALDTDWDREAISESVQRYGVDRFREELRAVVEREGERELVEAQ
jgi:glycosyltransferase involved in cell wall biosynthesis